MHHRIHILRRNTHRLSCKHSSQCHMEGSPYSSCTCLFLDARSRAKKKSVVEKTVKKCEISAFELFMDKNISLYLSESKGSALTTSVGSWGPGGFHLSESSSDIVPNTPYVCTEIAGLILEPLNTGPGLVLDIPNSST
jgi:hypothetical protein